jgi:hypothetical protein
VRTGILGKVLHGVQEDGKLELQITNYKWGSGKVGLLCGFAGFTEILGKVLRVRSG